MRVPGDLGIDGMIVLRILKK